jgi:phosphatidylserine/phosphatidylglycerophosphate/cardiolipin synthase-like enzyme
VAFPCACCFDRDRPQDLYQSSKINADAARLLKDQGVTVAFDAVDRVNHSKVVVIDEKRLLVGSHNWTRNSLMRLRALSVAIDNAAVAAHCASIIEAAMKKGAEPVSSTDVRPNLVQRF